MDSVENFPLAKQLDATIRFFLYLLIFWLPYSPAVIEVCVVVCVLLWFVKRFQTKSFRPVSTPINNYIYLFLFVCLISIGINPSFMHSFKSFFTKTLEWFVIYFLVVEVFKTKRQITVLLGVLLFTALSTGLDALYQYYISGKDIFSGHVLEPGGRATAAFRTPNGLGGYLTILIPFSLSMVFLKTSKPSHRYWAAAMFVVFFWSLIITFSHGAWLGVIVGIITFVLAFKIVQSKKRSLLNVGLIVIAGIFLCITLVSIKNISFAQRFTGQWRLKLWQDSVTLIKEKPLFGYGINSYMSKINDFHLVAQKYHVEDPSHAHNCYIQLAVETGILGLASLLAIFVVYFKRSMVIIKQNIDKDYNFMIMSLGLLAGLCAFLVHSFFETHFYTLKLSAYLWYIVGLQMVFIKRFA